MTHNNKYVLILIFILFFFFMADPIVWGLIPKSQSDAQLIDEAISTAIDDHNNDPDAHLGAGQSLQSHRAAVIIDHEAQSIVPDKVASANKFLYIPTNGAQDIFFDNQSSYNLGVLASVNHDSALTGSALAEMVNFQLSDMGYVSGDIVFDFMFSLSGNSGTKSAFFSTNFARVEIKDGNYRTAYYDGSWHSSSYTSYTQNIAQRWRIFYSAIDNTIYFYLNGVEIASYVQTPVFETSDYMVNVSLTRGTSTLSTAYFGGIDVGFISS